MSWLLIKFSKSFGYKFVDRSNFLRYILRRCQAGGWQWGNSTWKFNVGQWLAWGSFVFILATQR